MGQVECLNYYTSNGFARIIIDKVAEEMTRAGFKLDNMDEEQEEQIIVRLEELQVLRKLNEALKWSGVFGGAAIVLIVNDGQTLEMPLNIEKVENVEELRVYDRYEITERFKYSDPSKSKFGKTQIWQVSPSNGALPYYVHESRVLIFDGDSLPNQQRQANQGWGASRYQKAKPQIDQLTNAYEWAMLVLQRIQQAIHGIPDLSTTLQTPEGVKNVTNRVDIVDRVRNVQNTVVIDAEETYEVKSQTMAGIDAVLDRFAEALSTVTGIPVFLLMGRSIGGLNSTGDANRDGWYAVVNSMQNDQLRNPVDIICTCVMRSLGMTDIKYKLEFNPLYVPSDNVKADTDQKRASALGSMASALVSLVNSAIIDASEGREYVKETTEIPINDSIVPEIPTPPEPAGGFPTKSKSKK